jgi:hypothetical protein
MASPEGVGPISEAGIPAGGGPEFRSPGILPAFTPGFVELEVGGEWSPSCSANAIPPKRNITIVTVNTVLI